MPVVASLILIGFMPTVEGAHPRELVVLDKPIGTMPKGYLYFAIAFALLVEFLHRRIQPHAPRKKVKRNTYAQEAANGVYLRIQ